MSARSPEIEAAFTPATLQRLAEPGSLARGAAYVDEGRVEELTAHAGRMSATVRGTLVYIVELWVEDGAPRWSCDCPVGVSGALCKHCVAVVLAREPDALDALLDLGSEDDDGADARAAGRSDDDHEDVDRSVLEEWVRGRDPQRLAEIVLEQAALDWRLRERLLAEAAAVAGGSPDTETWRRRLETAFRTGDSVYEEEAASWARDVEELISAVTDLLDAGHADAVVELAEHAHRLADIAVNDVDDSDGWLTLISDDLARLHQHACELAGPDPVALAGRLVELELTLELDAFHRAAQSYADVLGEAGLAEYRRLLEPRFAALAGGERSGTIERYRVIEGMVGVALASGDPDLLIAVKSRDLRAVSDYQQVTSVLAEAGRVQEAIGWAERGLRAFPDRPWDTPPRGPARAAAPGARG